MNPILLIACIAFLAASIWSAIQRGWPLALISAGLFLITLHTSGLIT